MERAPQLFENVLIVISIINRLNVRMVNNIYHSNDNIIRNVREERKQPQQLNDKQLNIN